MKKTEEEYEEYEEYLENYAAYKADRIESRNPKDHVIARPMTYEQWQRACRMLAKYCRAINTRHTRAMELDPPYDYGQNCSMKELAKKHWKKADKLMSVVKKYEELLLI